MIIRNFREDDAAAVSELAINTFERYCGDDYFEQGAIRNVLDSWEYKNNPEFMDAMMRTDIFLVAADPSGTVAGLVRGNSSRINSLFVAGEYHRKGIGRMLMESFEAEARKQGSAEISLHASLYAAPFYERIGYKKLSGIIEYHGLKVYSMVKSLD